MRGWALAAIVVAGCAPAERVPAPPARPMRVVSLDYCADQYVLRFVPRARIAALSPYAEAEESYMRAAARGIATVRPGAEEVLALRPDLVVRSFGGGAGAGAMFARAGVPVLQMGSADDLAGVARVLVEMSAGLGAPAEGRRVAQAMRARLAAIDRGRGARRALYVTPGGVTSGPGTMIDALFGAAGLANFETAPGWRALPLERLAYARPDVVAAAFFGTRWDRADPWSAAGHPIVRATLAGRPTAALPGAWTACGGWFLVDAVEALARTAR